MLLLHAGGGVCLASPGGRADVRGDGDACRLLYRARRRQSSIDGRGAPLAPGPAPSDPPAVAESQYQGNRAHDQWNPFWRLCRSPLSGWIEPRDHQSGYAEARAVSTTYEA